MLFACLTAVALRAMTAAQEYKTTLPIEHPAIAYDQGPEPAALAGLGKALSAFPRKASEPNRMDAWLAPALAALGIGVDSQMLVFSKTSVQASRVSPSRPRAIYFSDEASIAFVPGAPTIELAAVDPMRGTLFYALSADGGGGMALTRSATCLHCHRGPNTSGVPGMYVGSVIPGPTGAPLPDDTAVITDHRTPFADRWGGWYVTARRGEQPDRANAVATDPALPFLLQRDTRQNLATLAGRFPTAAYAADASDIVALMVFEHQTQMINLLTRVSWQARIAIASGSADARTAALDTDIADLVRYMLFLDEAPLVEPVEGTTTFARTFASRGPRDPRGRSLRELDLQTRLFRYPLSYLIFSPSFDALPDAIRRRIYQRLFDLLMGDGAPWKGAVTAADRRTAVEIVGAAKPNAPDEWRRIR